MNFVVAPDVFILIVRWRICGNIYAYIIMIQASWRYTAQVWRLVPHHSGPALKLGVLVLSTERKRVVTT